MPKREALVFVDPATAQPRPLTWTAVQEARWQAQAAYQTVYEQTLRELAASPPAGTPDPA